MECKWNKKNMYKFVWLDGWRIEKEKERKERERRKKTTKKQDKRHRPCSTVPLKYMICVRKHKNKNKRSG